MNWPSSSCPTRCSVGGNGSIQRVGRAHLEPSGRPPRWGSRPVGPAPSACSGCPDPAVAVRRQRRSRCGRTRNRTGGSRRAAKRRSGSRGHRRYRPLWCHAPAAQLEVTGGPPAPARDGPESGPGPRATAASGLCGPRSAMVRGPSDPASRATDRGKPAAGPRNRIADSPACAPAGRAGNSAEGDCTGSDSRAGGRVPRIRSPAPHPECR